MVGAKMTKEEIKELFEAHAKALESKEFKDLVVWCKLRQPQYNYLPEVCMLEVLQTRIYNLKDLPEQDITDWDRKDFAMLPLIDKFLI